MCLYICSDVGFPVKYDYKYINNTLFGNKMCRNVIRLSAFSINLIKRHFRLENFDQISRSSVLTRLTSTV